MDTVRSMLLTILVFALLLSVLTAGSVSGKVVDDSTVPIPNAEVDLIGLPCDTVSYSWTPSSSTVFYEFTVTYVSDDPVGNTVDVQISYNDPVSGVITNTYTLSPGDAIELWTSYNGYLNMTVQSYDSGTHTADLDFVYCYKSLTASDGTFKIPQLPDGTYTLSFSAPGYQSATFGPFQIDNSDPTKTDRSIPIPIVLYPTGSGGGGAAASGSIAGTVKNSTGDPISGAVVEALIGNTLINSTTTDGTGAFNVTVDQSGSYTIRVTASGYIPYSYSGVNIDLTDPTQTHVTLPFTIVLTPSSTTYMYGYVTDENGDPVAGAQITTSYGSSFTTDASGFYNVTDVPEGVMFDLNVSAAGYSSTGITNLVLMSPLRYDFTIWSTSGSGYGTVNGYVFDTSGNPISGATVSAGGVSNTTNSSGYYILVNVPSGSQTVRASRSGYNTETQTVTVNPGSTVEVNFTLSESSSGGGSGGSGGGGSGSSGGGSYSVGSGTSGSSGGVSHAEEMEVQFVVSGCNVYVRRTVEPGSETMITLEVTSDCDTEGFELREYPPSGTSADRLKFVKNAPDAILNDPLTLVWRFENGVRKGDTVEIKYKVTENADIDEFKVRVYPLESEGVSIVPMFNLTVPKYAYVGDNVTVRLTTESGEPVPKKTIVVIPPTGHTFTLVTDDNGSATFIPGSSGLYRFSVEDAVLIKEASVNVIEHVSINLPSEHHEINVSYNETENGTSENAFVNMLSGLTSGLTSNLPVVVVIGVVIAVVVVLYFVSSLMRTLPDKGHTAEGGERQNEVPEHASEEKPETAEKSGETAKKTESKRTKRSRSKRKR